MTLSWYEKPLRIAALQCNFEGGREATLAVPAKWAEMGFNTEQLFHPMADAYSALFDVEQHGELLHEYVREAKKHGLRIIVYLNVHILGPSISHRYREWAQQAADGSFPKLYDTYYACCFNGPWREHFFRVLESLAPYDIDGVFLDGPVVVAGGCHCPSCRERYAARHGGDLDQATDLFRFYQEGRDDFLHESYRRFKAIKPDGVFYMNLPVMHPTASYTKLPEALAYNDIVGTEGGFMFYGPPKDAYLWKPSVAAKVLEAVAPHKPRVIFMAADQKPWSWYLHTPVETRLCIASTVANGAGIWYGLHGGTRLLETPGGKAAREIMQFLRANEPYYEQTESAARVAVMYSLDTERTYRTDAGASDFYGQGAGGRRFAGNMTESFHGVCDALCRSGVAFDVVTDLALTAEGLARYGCLFLPTAACLSDAAMDAIRRYVAAGGHIVATSDTSLYTPAGESRGELGLGDVFGVSLGTGPIPYHTWNYFTLAAKHPLFRSLSIPYYPAPTTVFDVRAAPSAEVLARFLAPMAGRYLPLTEPVRPAIVLHKFGKGSSLYLAGTFGEMISSYGPIEYRQLLKNAALLLSRSLAHLEGDSGNIELVVRRQGTRLIVHLINYAGIVPRPFEHVCPQTGVELHVAAEALAGRQGEVKLRALMSGCDCARRQEHDELIVYLPKIHEYEVVVLE